MDRVPRLIVRVTALVAALFGVLPDGYGQAQCTLYRVVIDGTTPLYGPSASTPQAAGQAFTPPGDGPIACQGGGTYTRVYQYGSYNAVEARVSYTSTVHIQGICQNPGPALDKLYLVNTFTGDCPLPPDCSDYDGPSAEGFLILGTEAETPPELCHNGSGCQATRANRTCTGGQCIAGYSISSRIDCPVGATKEDETTNNGAGEGCIGGGALEICMNNPGVNCGYVNSEYTCLPKAATGAKCFEPMSGAMICRDGTPMPPAPDNGTAGHAATPDAQVSNTTGSTTTNYNYYSNTTVNGSAREAGGTNEGAEEGGGGTCEGEECGEGEGAASGGDTCDAPPSCSGDPVQCVQLKQQWLQRCPGAVTDEQVDALLGDNAQIGNEEHDMGTSLAESLVVGGNTACPAPPVIQLPGGSSIEITVITWFCELAAKIAPLVMVAAYVAAVFIVVGRL